MATPTPWTREQWRTFARGYVVVRAATLAEDLAFCDAIGDACFEAGERGEPTCILHEVARRANAPCWCAKCRPAVRSAA